MNMVVASFRYESRSFDVSLLAQAAGVLGEQRRHHAAGDHAHVLEEGVQRLEARSSREAPERRRQAPHSPLSEPFLVPVRLLQVALLVLKHSRTGSVVSVQDDSASGPPGSAFRQSVATGDIKLI